MDYPASTLVRIKGKWYVSVTVPKPLEPHFKQKQIRRSTSTSDKRLAVGKQHGIAAVIYGSFDEARREAERNDAIDAEAQVRIAVNHFLKLIGCEQDGQKLTSSEVDPSWSGYAFQLDFDAHTIALESQLDSSRWSTEQTEAANRVLRPDVQTYLARRFFPELLPIISGDLNKSPRLSQKMGAYLDARPWGRQQSKNAARRQLESFIGHFDDPIISQITKSTAYRFAERLVEKENKAQKTIQSYLSAVKVFLSWCEKQEIIDVNPFVGLDLANYGRKSESWLPLTKAELFRLFKVGSLTKDDRLLLSLLITTGMRLDEAASLTWDQYHCEDGIRYFELAEAKVKNKASARKVVIPACAELPPPSVGRIFSYRLDVDGKASREASKALMPKFRKAITNERKTLHSLRGTLKDLLRDADVHKEVNDFITGHSQNDVASKYGAGPSLRTKYNAVNSVAHPWLT